MNEMLRRAMLALALTLAALTGLGYGSTLSEGQTPAMTPAAAPALHRDPPTPSTGIAQPGRTPMPRAGFP